MPREVGSTNKKGLHILQTCSELLLHTVRVVLSKVTILRTVAWLYSRTDRNESKL